MSATLTRNQRRYLARRVCAWCEMPLYPVTCGALFPPLCSERELAKRLKLCLTYYTPRPRRPRLVVSS